MEEKKRPFNPIITIISDTFVPGQKPKETVIDLTKASEDELEDLSKIHPEATYELFWRSLHDASNK